MGNKGSSQPARHVPQVAPYPVEVKEGETKYWCTCGLSKTQPFCDGSHEGTDFKPMAWTAPETKTYHMCGCKYTHKGPLCDGTHAEVNPKYEDGKKNCSNKSGHKEECKLCTKCGWSGMYDF